MPIEQALGFVESGSTVVASMAAAEPQAFLSAIGARCRSLSGVRLHCANPTRDYPCFGDAELAGRLEIRVMFLTAAMRRRQGQDRVHYVPQHLSQWVRNLLLQDPAPIFWGSCTPPDERGFVSLGPGACYEPEILRCARAVILEINPNMPVTFGATHVPIGLVDAFVEAPHALPTVTRVEPSAEEHQIAGHVAALIKDGSTIQLGIGGIPNALGRALSAKRDLGVHTEMINDTIMELCLQGVVTGRRKTLWPGKVVGSFAYGSAALYEFLHANPIVELQPSSVVNDPYRIGRNYAMVSVNTAVEVDLTGQVCSESIGHDELSGVGGAAETHIGAQRSTGGRGIVALRSSTRDGTSKIVFELKPGAKVSISRNDVDTIVTEHGVAMLGGKSVEGRVRAMVALAPADARERLLWQARQAAYL